jgi:hypothetical protein
MFEGRRWLSKDMPDRCAPMIKKSGSSRSPAVSSQYAYTIGLISRHNGRGMAAGSIISFADRFIRSSASTLEPLFLYDPPHSYEELAAPHSRD